MRLATLCLILFALMTLPVPTRAQEAVNLRDGSPLQVQETFDSSENSVVLIPSFEPYGDIPPGDATSSGRILGRGSQPPGDEEAGDSERIPGSRRLSYLLVEATNRSGMAIYADSTVTVMRVVPPAFEIGASEAAVERWLNALLPNLPDGVRWIKLYLPPARSGKKWTGDTIANYAMALSALYGTVGTVQPGKSEILSRQIANDEAQNIKQKMELRPVYLLTLRGSRTFSGVWNTTFGQMRLTVRGNHVTGTYTANQGSLQGEIRNGTLYFDWYEQLTKGQGRGYFVLSDDGMSFNGKWGSGAAEPNSEWTGARIINATSPAPRTKPAGGRMLNNGVYLNNPVPQETAVLILR